MTFRDGFSGDSHNFLTKTFKTVHDGNAGEMAGVRVSIHGPKDSITLSQLFALIKMRPAGDYEVGSAYEWNGKSDQEAPVLVANRTFEEPRVIGTRVLVTDDFQMDGSYSEMHRSNGHRASVFQPKITEDIERNLYSKIDNSRVVDHIISMLESPSVEGDLGQLSAIEVFDCPIGDRHLYALKYSNRLRVGYAPHDPSSRTDFFLNFYDERGVGVSMQQLQRILENAKPNSPINEAKLEA